MSTENLDKIQKYLEKLEKYLEKLDNGNMMIVVLLIELNGLMKKLNYISGTDRGFSELEIKKEIDWVTNYVKCITEKGSICPIRGLTSKLGKHLEEEIKEEGEKPNV